MSVQIDRLPLEAFKPDPEYAERYLNSQAFDIFDGLAFKPGGNLLISGPKGTGKSLSVFAWAAKHEIPIVTYSCAEDARDTHLLGQFVLRNGETPFVLGPIPTALEVANEAGRCILLLEEINALTPSAQKILNPLCDWHQRLEVPSLARIFELRNGAKLWVAGTLNDAANYGGVYALNEDLRSRFNVLPVDYHPIPREREILLHLAKRLDIDVKADTVDALLNLALETRQGQVDYALSTRDLLQALVAAQSLPIDAVKQLILGKFESKDRAMMKERMRSLFA